MREVVVTAVMYENRELKADYNDMAERLELCIAERRQLSESLQRDIESKSKECRDANRSTLSLKRDMADLVSKTNQHKQKLIDEIQGLNTKYTAQSEQLVEANTSITRYSSIGR